MKQLVEIVPKPTRKYVLTKHIVMKYHIYYINISQSAVNKK